jgi:hypothetical protein
MGIPLPDVEVDGADLEIRLVFEDQKAGLAIPYNENGDSVYLKVDNATLKRWRAEYQDAVKIMRRAASGEKNTAYYDQVPDGRGFIRGRA